MSTIGSSRFATKYQKGCNNSRKAISWIETCEKQNCDLIIYKPIFKFWPPPPSYLTEYDFFETADAYVNPPNWKDEMSQSCGSGTWNCTYSSPRECVYAASNVRQVGSPRNDYTEKYLRTEQFKVTFAWYGARRNPLYPGTYGAPPYIRELIPADKLPNNGVFDRPRRVFERRVKTLTQYSGWINCNCGQPRACGCSSGPSGRGVNIGPR